MTATQMGHTLGIDFGTSNSAAGIAVDGAAHLIPLDGTADTIPTAVFFDFDSKRTVYGAAANRALFEGEWGRYMRALKSILGTGLCHERRTLLGERLTFIDIIGRFLAEVKKRAETATGLQFDHALSGRPVRFHSANEARNAQALEDLKACYAAAGFQSVRFMPEPEAAARANAHLLSGGDLGLVVDIGGGTSDFTVFRAGGQAGQGVDILGSHGVRLGGTDFDRTLSLDHVMPLLGKGSEIRHAFGNETHLAPNALFGDLATWAKIQFLYAADTRRQVADLLRYAVSPERIGRLARVLEDELGHDVAFAVEAGKIEANARADATISLANVEKGLTSPLSGADLYQSLGDAAATIATEAKQAVTQTDKNPSDITHVILVGGSSLLGVVESGLAQAFPDAQRHRGAALTAITQGLALATGD